MNYLNEALKIIQEKKSRVNARKDFLSFIQYTKPNYIINWHHMVMAAFIQKWIEGKIKNLIISAPPRHSKSENVSRRLPAFLLGLNPNTQIISTNYNDSLAQNMGRDVQRIVDSEKYYTLFPNTQLYGSPNLKLNKHEKYTRTLNEFQIARHEGIYRTGGIRTGITGKGCWYLLIDDYIKNYKESISSVIKKEIWNEYVMSLRSRLEGPKQTIITATRWADDDLIGKILEVSKDPWVVINFEAIKTDKSIPYDPRKIGEALWPQKMSLEELIATREISPIGFITMYQGAPPIELGQIFQSDWFIYFDNFPGGPYQVYQSWDTAFKAGQENDYNVCTTWRVYADGYYLLDIFRERMTYPDLKQKAIQLYNKYKPQIVLIEDKASGQSLIQDLQLTTNIPIVAIGVDSDKISRANAISGLFQSGRVRLYEKGQWLFDYTEELKKFCMGCEFDDQVDSTSQFLNYIKPADMVNDIIVGHSQCDEEF